MDLLIILLRIENNIDLNATPNVYVISFFDLSLCDVYEGFIILTHMLEGTIIENNFTISIETA